MLLQLLVAGSCATVGALNLPSYITACEFNDPDLDGCALTEARKAIKRVVNGDQKYRIPNLEPLIIQELKVDQDSANQAVGFSFVASNCTVWGLSDVKINAIRIDRKYLHNELDLVFPRLEIKGHYKARGKVLMMPLTGTGVANITLTNVPAVYGYNITVKHKVDGDYAVITDTKLDYKINGRAYVHLESLSNGGNVLVDSINTVLKDNWEVLVKEFGPPIAEALGEVIKIVMGGIFDTVPLNNAYRGYPRP